MFLAKFNLVFCFTVLFWAARSVQMKTTLARLTAMCRLKSNFTLYTFENKTKCLWFNNFRDTFQQAKSRCEDLGAYLAVIKSYKEYVIFSTNKRSEWTWIGLDDIQKEGVYMWQDGSRARQFPYVHFSRTGIPPVPGATPDVCDCGQFIYCYDLCIGRGIYMQNCSVFAYSVCEIQP
ncbi:CD209 antigen-like protein E isoform X2 [Biomphalaria glabrata]|uniref:CD209 antigen-like protein E isoform X2 n=1 Tax=Biomphalaria glabrata TaxID=6526 RepID=A0A9W3BDT7_BIOGL|nr:CD209 antigen-like protein E isoform X2 [Biomphalaria glabrata]